MNSKIRSGSASQGEEPKNTFFDNLWLDTKEAAVYLRTTPKQIRKWIYQGKIKAYKLLGHSYRFKMRDLDSLIKGVG